jgi:hypothetical protein
MKYIKFLFLVYMCGILGSFFIYNIPARIIFEKVILSLFLVTLVGIVLYYIKKAKAGNESCNKIKDRNYSITRLHIGIWIFCGALYLQFNVNLGEARNYLFFCQVIIFFEIITLAKKLFFN